MIFSSLWCIKDRDPKQAERKVLSFQRHYSIPPPRCQGPIYYFFVFAFFSLLRAEGARVYFDFRSSFYVYLCVLSLFFAERGGLGTPLRRFAPAPPQGEPSHHRQQRQSWRSGKEIGKFASPQSFPLSTGVTWLPPWGSWHRVRQRPVTERGAKKKSARFHGRSEPALQPIFCNCMIFLKKNISQYSSCSPSRAFI